MPDDTPKLQEWIYDALLDHGPGNGLALMDRIEQEHGERPGYGILRHLTTLEVKGKVETKVFDPPGVAIYYLPGHHDPEKIEIDLDGFATDLPGNPRKITDSDETHA